MSTILIVYYSCTGFTKRYAEKLAAACGGKAVDLRHVSRTDLKRARGVVFGTRAFAGRLPKIQKMRRLLKRFSSLPQAIFVTGAMPETATESLERLWDTNLTEAERETVPHFYLPSGLNYEAMGFRDRVMMAGLKAFLDKSPAKTEEGQALAQIIATSFDHSSDTYMEPVLTCIRSWKEGPVTD